MIDIWYDIATMTRTKTKSTGFLNRGRQTWLLLSTLELTLVQKWMWVLLEVVGLIHVAHKNDKIWLIHYTFYQISSHDIRFTAPIRFSQSNHGNITKGPFLKSWSSERKCQHWTFSVYFLILASLDLKSNGTIKWDTEKQRCKLIKYKT